MSKRTDHFADAEENLRAIGESLAGEQDPTLTVAEMIGLAQLQATLALVEQQRIANILTLVGDEDWETVDADLRDVYGVDPAAVRADIVAALGWSR